jgi:hypothetical protein
MGNRISPFLAGVLGVFSLILDYYIINGSGFKLIELLQVEGQALLHTHRPSIVITLVGVGSTLTLIAAIVSGTDASIGASFLGGLLQLAGVVYSALPMFGRFSDSITPGWGMIILIPAVVLSTFGVFWGFGKEEESEDSTG